MYKKSSKLQTKLLVKNCGTLIDLNSQISLPTMRTVPEFCIYNNLLPVLGQKERNVNKKMKT